MKSDRKQTILFIIILLVMSMGIGYAFLTTTLTIDGISDIDSSSWDVHFENVQVQSGSVTGSQVTTPATISADGLSISFNIRLKEPGEAYVFDVDVVNAGTLDAMVDNVIFRINGEENFSFPEYLNTNLTYGEYGQIQQGDLLKSGETEKVEFGVGYMNVDDPNDLPSENQSILFSIQLVYKQVKIRYLYSTSTANIIERDALPNNVVTYDSYQQAINNFGHDFYHRFGIIDGKVYERAVGFIYNGNVYYLTVENVRGQPGNSNYIRNKELLNNVFGESYCQTVTNYYSNPKYVCEKDGYVVTAYMDGDVDVDKDGYDCYAIAEGEIYCGSDEH